MAPGWSEQKEEEEQEEGDLPEVCRFPTYDFLIFPLSSSLSLRWAKMKETGESATEPVKRVPWWLVSLSSQVAAEENWGSLEDCGIIRWKMELERLSTAGMAEGDDVVEMEVSSMAARSMAKGNKREKEEKKEGKKIFSSQIGIVNPDEN